jgi:hypothetical protein
MTARTSGDLARRVAAQLGADRAMVRRTHQPVHRRSFHAGEREEREWRQHNRFPRSQDNARLRALQEIEEQQRYADREGRRRRREDNVMRGVYRFLLRLRGKLNGRLDPTYQTIAASLHYAPSAVKAAMKRLSDLGFVRWIRRTRLLDEPQPGGQFVEQISNAYVLELTGRAADLVRRILRQLTPDQERDRARQQRDAETAAMTLEQAVDVVADPELRALLSRMGDRLRSAGPPDGLNPAL